MKKLVLFVFICCSIVGRTQTTFTSKKYDYSFSFPKGWKQSDNITFSKVDAKIVDGKGSSFVVTVEVFKETITRSITEMYEELTNAEIESMFEASFGKGLFKLIKRGTTYVDNKPFYFIHLLSDSKNGKMLNKMFLYCKGHTMISINMSCFNDDNLEVGPYLASMLSSFKLGTLK